MASHAAPSPSRARLAPLGRFDGGARADQRGLRWPGREVAQGAHGSESVPDEGRARERRAFADQAAACACGCRGPRVACRHQRCSGLFAGREAPRRALGGSQRPHLHARASLCCPRAGTISRRAPRRARRARPTIHRRRVRQHEPVGGGDVLSDRRRARRGLGRTAAPGVEGADRAPAFVQGQVCRRLAHAKREASGPDDRERSRRERGHVLSGGYSGRRDRSRHGVIRRRTGHRARQSGARRRRAMRTEPERRAPAVRIRMPDARRRLLGVDRGAEAQLRADPPPSGSAPACAARPSRAGGARSRNGELERGRLPGGRRGRRPRRGDPNSHERQAGSAHAGAQTSGRERAARSPFLRCRGARRCSHDRRRRARAPRRVGHRGHDSRRELLRHDALGREGGVELGRLRARASDGALHASRARCTADRHRTDADRRKRPRRRHHDVFALRRRGSSGERDARHESPRSAPGRSRARSCERVW